MDDDYDEPLFFDMKTGIYRFLHELDDVDSGVEELPFASYLDQDEVCLDSQSQSQAGSSQGIMHLKDGRQWNENYRHAQEPRTQLGSQGEAKSQFVYSGCSHYDASFYTPEKPSDVDSEGSLYAQASRQGRKPRTPRTIQMMMEKHRQNERVRHHSLNESLKDVCMRVPGFDPSAKETKVVQMQRIIGYECYLENTLTSLCEQLGISPASLGINTNFITEAIKNTPMEDFYQQSNYRTSDVEDEESDLSQRYKNSPKPIHGYRVLDQPHDGGGMWKYRQEKISSPTVDSTTGGQYEQTPCSRSHSGPRMYTRNEAESGGSRLINGLDTHLSAHFMPIMSSPRDDSACPTQLSSQESGIKLETQSSPDEDSHFQDIDNLIESSLYQEADQLKHVTPSFMREETVTTSLEDGGEESFSLVSPQHFILHSPPPRGIWHSASKLNMSMSSSSDTPKRNEMISVSPENVLETMVKMELDAASSSHTTDCNNNTASSIANRQVSSSVIFVNQEEEPLLELSQASTSSSTNSFTKSVYGEVGYASSRTSTKPKIVPTIHKIPVPNLSAYKHRFLPLPADTVNLEPRIIRKPCTNLRNVRINIVRPLATDEQKSPNALIANRIMGHSSNMPESGDVNSMDHTTSSGLPHVTIKKVKLENMNSMPTKVSVPDDYLDFDLLSPEGRNKRKRYMPLHSPLQNITNQKKGGTWECLQPSHFLDHLVDMPRPAYNLPASSCPVMPTSTATSSTGHVMDGVGLPGKDGQMLYSKNNRNDLASVDSSKNLSQLHKLMGLRWNNTGIQNRQSNKEKTKRCGTYWPKTLQADGLSQDQPQTHSILVPRNSNSAIYTPGNAVVPSNFNTASHTPGNAVVPSNFHTASHTPGNAVVPSNFHTASHNPGNAVVPSNFHTTSHTPGSDIVPSLMPRRGPGIGACDMEDEI